jgi:hypothetical protein
MPVRIYAPEPGVAPRRRREYPYAVAPGSPLAAGAASFVSSGPSPAGIVVSATDATGGTAPYTYQWKRSVDGGAYSNLANGGGVSGATTRSLTDASATTGHTYAYQIVYTDAASHTASSNVVTASVYTGGALSGGGFRFVGTSGGF